VNSQIARSETVISTEVNRAAEDAFKPVDEAAIVLPSLPPPFAESSPFREPVTSGPRRQSGSVFVQDLSSHPPDDLPALDRRQGAFVESELRRRSYFRFREARSADPFHSLGPFATWSGPVATVENASSSGSVDALQIRQRLD